VSERLRPLIIAVALCGLLGAAAPVPDPTRPAIAPRAESTGATPAAAALVLQSTIVSPRQRSAIINGQRYRLGESVGEARLEAIGPGWVRLRGPTGSTELRLSFPKSTRPVNR
jgi:hypothetical protein